MARKQAKAKQSRPRSSELDVVTSSIMQEHAHDSTRDIVNRRDVLTFEVTVANQEIKALQEKLSAVKARREALLARLVGLTLLISKR